jgi:anaerobic selenocysteine-containing dehydrogenase
VPLKGARLLLRQNKAKGFACVSCAWAKPKSNGLEFCENGAKATAWEIDAHRATPELFSKQTEIDRQASGRQAVSVEDSTGFFHASRGFQKPASEHLKAESTIIAEIAKATLPLNPKVDWDGWLSNYDRIRESIEQTFPDHFADFNRRMWQPEGFQRKIPARQREWKTKTGKANIICPKSLREDSDMADDRGDILLMITLRSNDQFNTTIYGYDDRFRGIRGTRSVVLMNIKDVSRLGLAERQEVTLATVSDDGVDRRLGGLMVVTYNIPEGCIGTYYPEANVLIPLWHHAERSKVPAAKSVPVRVLCA